MVEELLEMKLVMISSLREAIAKKIPEFYEILSQNGDPSPPYCFYEILIHILPLILGYLLFLNKRYEIRLTSRPVCEIIS